MAPWSEHDTTAQRSTACVAHLGGEGEGEGGLGLGGEGDGLAAGGRHIESFKIWSYLHSVAGATPVIQTIPEE